MYSPHFRTHEKSNFGLKIIAIFTNPTFIIWEISRLSNLQCKEWSIIYSFRWNFTFGRSNLWRSETDLSNVCWEVMSSYIGEGAGHEVVSVQLWVKIPQGGWQLQVQGRQTVAASCIDTLIVVSQLVDVTLQNPGRQLAPRVQNCMYGSASIKD